MDLTIDNVLTRTTINWDEPNIYSGITPIKYSHIKELEDAINIIATGVEKHAAMQGIDTTHGRVSSTNSGFMTKELVARIEALKANLIAFKEKVQELSPSNFITAFDKAPSDISTGYVWCNGENDTPNTRGKTIMCSRNASPLDEYPDGKYTMTEASTSTADINTLTTIKATFQKRV